MRAQETDHSHAPEATAPEGSLLRVAVHGLEQLFEDAGEMTLVRDAERLEAPHHRGGVSVELPGQRIPAGESS